jgi:mRNA interferase RelE/StbE
MRAVFEITISGEAVKTLRRMPRNVRDLIIGKIEDLAVDPPAPNNNVRRLTGRPGYRLRVGDWRVIYDLDHGLRILAVERMAPRGGAYE